MHKEYWASKTYIGVMATVTLGWSFLSVYPYVFINRQPSIETYVISSVMAVILIFLCGIINRLVRYPHVKLCNGNIVAPPGIMFSSKTINLGKPFHVSENRGNIGVQQERQYVNIIYRVLPEKQYLELRSFLLSHEFNM
jgi:membrane protein YdbS with pleckstrin-like domain